MLLCLEGADVAAHLALAPMLQAAVPEHSLACLLVKRHLPAR
jgi:hypothetical protein